MDNYFKNFIKKADNLESNNTTNIMDWDLKLIKNNYISDTDKMINDLKNKNPSNNIINNNSVIYTNPQTISQNYTNWKDFKKPELQYDNLNKDGKTEVITQNILSFDSIDRDINNFINPFNYRIIFNPSSINTNAYINKNYKNVKYLSLEYIILPRKFYLLKKNIIINNDITQLSNNFLNLKQNDTYNNFIIPDLDNDYTIVIIDKYDMNDTKIIVFTKLLDNYTKMEECWEISMNNNIIKLTYFYFSNYLIENDKYLLLNIDEINNNYNYSTNMDIQKSFGILLPNLLNGDYFYLDTKIIEKIYRYSNLGNIDKLTINILNSKGNKININIDCIDKNVNTPKNCICNNNIRYYNCSCTYIRHLLYHKFQNLILFKLGYIEPDIDKRVFD
jgi:hypothetical protein